ncbi:MAG: MotA/TolQ/ExbB proton channel family protein [Gemmataceae bacterium]
MRRRLIQTLLPFAFAILPLLAALLILATLPPIARQFYFEHITPLDMVILSLGGGLFLLQSYLAFQALRWIGEGFNERPDPWLNRLAQSSEWFPLLGLIGTVGGILQTFSSITGTTAPERIIQLYAPALTATGSGLFMALVNILPAWMVLVGRGLITSLGDDDPTDAVPR